MNENLKENQPEDTTTKKEAQYISISAAEALTDIPNATLKRYMINHDQYVDYRKIGREYRINVADIETLKYIRSLYNAGMRKEVVNEKLHSEGMPVTITFPSGDEADQKALISVNEELAEVKKMLQAQMQFNKQLVEEVDTLKSIIKNEFQQQLLGIQGSHKASEEQLEKRLEERLKEVAAEIVASKDMEIQELKEQQSKGFFQKLFGK